MSWVRRYRDIGVRILSSSGDTYASDAHSRIHQGKMFYTHHLAFGVADDASLRVALTTPVGDWPHLTVHPSATGESEAAIYEGTAISAGTPLDIFNMKRYSTRTFGGVAVHTPTINSLGTQIMHKLLPGGQIAFATGIVADFDYELNLRENTVYLIEVTNRSGQAAGLGLELIFYTAPELADDND